MAPELEAELRSTVASLLVRTAYPELLNLALLPTLPHYQQEAMRERLDHMEASEEAPSRLVDEGKVNRKQRCGYSLPRFFTRLSRSKNVGFQELKMAMPGAANHVRDSMRLWFSIWSP
jgi:hypothetical protein